MTLVRPEFEPTLPKLVRQRTGLRERTTVLLLALALAALVVAVVLVRPRVDRISSVTHGDDPAFTLQYRNDLFESVEPRPGELARLEGSRGRQSVTMTVRPLELPAHEGDVAHALLPVYASGHIEELAGQLDDFQLRAEHRARVHDAPGYEIRFRTGPPGRRTFGSDLMLVPGEQEEQRRSSAERPARDHRAREAHRARGGVCGSGDRGGALRPLRHRARLSVTPRRPAPRSWAPAVCAIRPRDHLRPCVSPSIGSRQPGNIPSEPCPPHGVTASYPDHRYLSVSGRKK